MSTITFGGAVVGGAEAPVSAFGGSEIIGGLYEAVSGGVTGGASKKRASAPMKDAAGKLNVMNLQDYGNSIYAEEKEKMIRAIAKDIFNVVGANGIKNVDTADIGTVVKQLVKNIPTGSSGKRVKFNDEFNNSSGKQSSVCKRLATVINKHCGGIINMDLGESGMCDKISEVILSLVTGLHTEFMTVAGDILRVLNNMQLAQDYLTSAYQKQKELIESSGDDSLKLQSGETDKVYEEVMTEYKRQMTILSNLINVTVGPSGKVLISALENNEDFTGTVRNLKEMMGTKAFGDKLSYLLSGVSSVAHSAEIITKALKQIGFAVKDFCSVKNAGELQSKLVQFVAKSGPSSKQLDEMMKAIKLIMNADYNHEAICKLLSKSGGRGPGNDSDEDEDVDGGYDGVFGGASRDELLDTFGDDDTNTVPRYANRTLERKRLDKKIDAKDRQRGLLLFEFKKQLQSLIRGVVDSANSIADKIGNTLPVSDDLKHFVTKFGALPTLDKERLHEMLSGYYKDAKTREGREKFLDQYESVIKACENLTKGSSGSLFSSLSNSLSKVVDAVDTFSDKIVKAITEIHIDRPGEIEAKLRETAARFYGGGESGDDLFGSGSWVELDTVRTVMKYRLSIANIKTNLARTTQDLREYTSDYEQILGEESAWLIDTVKKQFMSRINIDMTKRPPVGTATAVAKTWTELHIINKNNASHGKEAFESLRTLWTFQMNAKINMIKAAQAVDMYLKSFTNGMSKNPDSIGSIVKMLSEVEHVAKWFTEKSGDNLASLFDVFPASLAGGSIDKDYLGGANTPVEASGSCKIPFGDATLSHYYLYVSRQYATKKLPGNPFLGRPLSGNKTASKQCRGIIMLSKKVIKTMRALENILSAFSSVGSKFGDVTPAADTFMTPGQIFNALCDYVAASAFTNEFTSNLGDNRFDFSYMTDLNDPKRGTVAKDQYKELKPAAVQTVAIYNNGDNLIPNDLRKDKRMGRLNRVETKKFSDANTLRNEFAPKPPPSKKDMAYLEDARDRARNSGNDEHADTLDSLINELKARADAADYAAYKKSNDAAVDGVKKLAGDLRTEVDTLNTTVTAARSDAVANFDALTKTLEEINKKSKEFSTSVGLLLSVDAQLTEINAIEELRANYDATPTGVQVNAVYTAGQTALRLDYGSAITNTNAKIADDALMNWLNPRIAELEKLKALMDAVATPLPAMVKSADDAVAVAAAAATAAAEKLKVAEQLAEARRKFESIYPLKQIDTITTFDDLDLNQNPKPKRRGNSISFHGEIPYTDGIKFKPEPEPERYGFGGYGINSNGVLWYNDSTNGPDVVYGVVAGSVDLVPIYVTNTLFNGRNSILCLSTSAGGPPTEFTLGDGEVYDSFNTSDGILNKKKVEEEKPREEPHIPHEEPYVKAVNKLRRNDDGYIYTSTDNSDKFMVVVGSKNDEGEFNAAGGPYNLNLNEDGSINYDKTVGGVVQPDDQLLIYMYNETEIYNDTDQVLSSSIKEGILTINYGITSEDAQFHGGGFSSLGSELGIKVGTLKDNKFTSLALAGLPTAGYGSSVSEYHKWEDDPENKPKMLMSGWRDMFADTDMLYQMTVKSVVAKIFTAVDAFRLFHRPVDNVRATYSLNPVRSILGGADGGADAPKVRIIPEAVELYYRLVLLAEWYRDIFGVKSKDASALQGASTDAWRVTIVPNLDGVWSEFVSLVFDKAEYVKDGNYSDAQVRGLVRCINEIWNTYKSKHPTSTTRHILNSFVLEMNRSFGFLRQDDIQKYIERSLDQQRMGDDGDDDLVIYDILDAENSYGSRPAPSDKFSSVNGQRKPTRTTSSMVFLQEAIGNLRKKIDVQFMNLGKSNNYVSQFTDTLDQYKKSVSIAKSDSESFKVVANMLQKADAKISANVDQYMILYESVVVPLNVLSMVYNMLDTFNNRCHGLSIENMRKYKAVTSTIDDTAFKKDYKEFLEKQYKCDTSYKPYLENFAKTLSDNMASYSITKDKTLIAGTNIEFTKIMKLLLQTMLDIGANQSKLIEVTVSSNGTINIDFGTITDLCTKLLSTVKSNCKKLRNLPGGINTIVDKFETLSPKGDVKTTRDFEEHLINKLCGNKYNMGLAAALVHLRNTFDAITNQYKDDKGAFGSSRDVSDSTCKFVDTADQSVAALIYYDQTVAASLAASTGAAGRSYFVDNMVFPGNVVALTKNLETTDEKVAFNNIQTSKNFAVVAKGGKISESELYKKLHQMPIITFTGAGGVDGDKGLLDFNKDSNSLFFAFNTAVMQYLNTTVDDNALKTYAPLFDQYVSGPGALEVIQKRGFPNVRDGVVTDNGTDIVLKTAVGTLGGLSVEGGVLYNSNAIIIRSLLNTSVQTSSATRKRFLYDNLLEMPEFLKDRLKTNLPLFVKIFSSIADRADLLRGLLQNTNLKRIIVSSQKGTGLTVTGTNFSLKSPGLLADLSNTSTNDTAQMTKYYSKLLSRLSESARSLRKCADVVYRELQDKPPVFFETSRDFLEDYAQRMNARPFMPYSLITAPLCDGVPDTRDLNKIKTLFPGKDNGTPEFKYKYATRSLLNQNVNFTLDHFPGSKLLYNNYAQLTSKNMAISPEEFTGTVQSTCTLMRFIQNGYQSAIMFNGDADNSKYLYKPGKEDAFLNQRQLDKVVELVENTTSANASEQVATSLTTGSITSIASNSRLNLQMYNILDADIVPLNVHAFMREVPFANLINYSYTFDRMIVDFLMPDFYNTRKDDLDKYNVTFNQYSVAKTSREMLAKLLIYPFVYCYKGAASNRLSEYFTHVRGLFNGDDDLQLGRPKYLSDQLWHKVLLSNTVDTTNNLYGSNGALQRRIGAPAISGHNGVIGLQSRVSSKAFPARAITGLVSDANDSVYMAELGKMRFDTKLVRNLVWFVQLQRVLRVVLISHLSWINTPVVRGLKLIDPKITEYDNDDTYEDDEFSAKNYKLV